MNPLIAELRGKLIVSCQALDDEPLYSPQGGIMPLMARAAIQGGAAAIRANTPRDIREIKEALDVPVIGLNKQAHPGFAPYITATLPEVDAIVAAGADIVAMDCTARPRPDGLTIGDAIAAIKQNHPGLPVMADISTFDEGLQAEAAGADIVATTLNHDPDIFDLVRQLCAACQTPIFAEGGIHDPQSAARMIELGAWSVVVGGAITRPLEITSRFVAAISRDHPVASRHPSNGGE